MKNLAARFSGLFFLIGYLLSGCALLKPITQPVPAQHVETFSIKLDATGHATVKFKTPFQQAPTCTASYSPAGGGLEWYPDKVIVHGVPGDAVLGTCK